MKLIFLCIVYLVEPRLFGIFKYSQSWSVSAILLQLILAIVFSMYRRQNQPFRAKQATVQKSPR